MDFMGNPYLSPGFQDVVIMWLPLKSLMSSGLVDPHRP